MTRDFGFQSAIYNETYDEHTPFLQTYARGFSDLYLISPEGTIVYSLKRKADSGLHLARDKEVVNSGIKMVFEKALKRPNTVVIEDFSYYTPSAAPALFFAKVLKDDTDLVVGLLVMEAGIDEINKVMGDRTGLGPTSETYLIGPDQLFRSDPYLDPANHYEGG